MVFEEGGKQENRLKNPRDNPKNVCEGGYRCTGENQHVVLLTYDGDWGWNP